MVQQHSDSDRVGVRESGKPRLSFEPLLDFVVEVKLAFRGQLQRRGSNESLSNTPGEHQVIRHERSFRHQVGHSS